MWGMTFFVVFGIRVLLGIEMGFYLMQFFEPSDSILFCHSG